MHPIFSGDCVGDFSVESADGIVKATHALFDRMKNGDILIAYDFDGTVLDTMAAHGRLAADCMHAEFGTEYKEAMRLYYSTTGIPFPKQLEKIYPKGPAEKRKACADNYWNRKTAEVYRATKPFPEIKETLELTGTFAQKSTIASSTEAWLIKELTGKHGLTKYFESIWGCEEGSKQEHIARMRKKYKIAAVIFVGDSTSDVKMKEKGADLTIGKAGPKESGMLSPAELVAAGADYATEDLRDINRILDHLTNLLCE